MGEEGGWGGAAMSFSIFTVCFLPTFFFLFLFFDFRYCLIPNNPHKPQTGVPLYTIIFFIVFISSFHGCTELRLRIVVA